MFDLVMKINIEIINSIFHFCFSNDFLVNCANFHVQNNLLYSRAHSHIMVSDLLLPSGNWNEALINEFFLPIDVEIICALPSI